MYKFYRIKLKDQKKFKFIVVQYYSSPGVLSELVLPTDYLVVYNVGINVHLSYTEEPFSTLEISKHYYIDSKYVKDIFWTQFKDDICEE